MSRPVIVCLNESSDPGWRWIESSIADTGVSIEFVLPYPRNVIEKFSYFNLARIRGALSAVLAARRLKARAIIAHGPTLSAWTALFMRACNLNIPLLAHTFNFTALPGVVKRRVFAFALSSVSRFVVFSTMEKDLYARAFNLSPDRFDVVLWGVNPPAVHDPERAYEPGEYVCAIGGNARDYRTLIEAARKMADIKFILVVRPRSLEGLEVPANVVVHVNLASGTAMNVLLHSRFMVLPLIGEEVPCGHVTMVAAMHLRKAFIITASDGVRDYVRDGENALAVGAGSATDLVEKIRRLWEDPELCAKLGKGGQSFASQACSETNIVRHFRAWLKVQGIRARVEDPPGTSAIQG